MSRAEPIAARRSAAFAPDRVVGVLAADGYHVHQLVYAAFARGGARRFLFCPVARSGDSYRVRVRSYDIATCFGEGQEFSMELRAMPTVKMGGKRRSVATTRSKDPLRLRWIRARAHEHGFELRCEPSLRVERVRLEGARLAFGLNVCTYRVRVRVTDAAKFAHAYARGIGQGRAWGCGMMILTEPAADPR